MSENKEPTLADVLERVKELRVAGQAAFNYADLAVYINVSESTVRRMARQPKFPQQKAIQTDENGNAIRRFLKTDIDAWLKSAPVSRAS